MSTGYFTDTAPCWLHITKGWKITGLGFSAQRMIENVEKFDEVTEHTSNICADNNINFFCGLIIFLNSRSRKKLIRVNEKVLN